MIVSKYIFLFCSLVGLLQSAIMPDSGAGYLIAPVIPELTCRIAGYTAIQSGSNCVNFVPGGVYARTSTGGDYLDVSWGWFVGGSEEDAYINGNITASIQFSSIRIVEESIAAGEPIVDVEFNITVPIRATLPGLGYGQITPGTRMWECGNVQCTVPRLEFPIFMLGQESVVANVHFEVRETMTSGVPRFGGAVSTAGFRVYPVNSPSEPFDSVTSIDTPEPGTPLLAGPAILCLILRRFGKSTN